MQLVFEVARPSRHGDYSYVRTRTVDRPYACAPRQGDLIEVDDDGELAVPVDSVTWAADGAVHLELGELPELAESELDEMGFSPTPNDDEVAQFEDDDSDTIGDPMLEPSDSRLEDVDPTFTATPPKELQNVELVLEYLSPSSVGEVLNELLKYDRSIPVEISSDDDELDEDTIYRNYPSGRDGEGVEFVDLQAVWLRAAMSRSTEMKSTCILCGADIIPGLPDTHGHWHWIHATTGLRECADDSTTM
jgi:hypothetical protein